MQSLPNFRLRALCAALALGFSFAANAVPVFPGGSMVAVGELDPVGGATVFTTSDAFTSLDLSGTLVSTVISGDTSNPYGLNCLTFTYQIILDAVSPHPASALSMSSFAGYSIDMSYYPIGGTVSPQYFSRSPDGAVVRFSWVTTAINPGQSSALLVVQTDALAYALTTVGVLDGDPARADSVALLPIPEPTALALLIPGLFALRFIRRKA